jgi:hypothetical protein
VGIITDEKGSGGNPIGKALPEILQVKEGLRALGGSVFLDAERATYRSYRDVRLTSSKTAQIWPEGPAALLGLRNANLYNSVCLLCIRGYVWRLKRNRRISAGDPLSAGSEARTTFTDVRLGLRASTILPSISSASAEHRRPRRTEPQRSEESVSLPPALFACYIRVFR